jgi:hypothetical protein
MEETGFGEELSFGWEGLPIWNGEQTRTLSGFCKDDYAARRGQIAVPPRVSSFNPLEQEWP